MFSPEAEFSRMDFALASNPVQWSANRPRSDSQSSKVALRRCRRSSSEMEAEAMTGAVEAVTVFVRAGVSATVVAGVTENPDSCRESPSVGCGEVDVTGRDGSAPSVDAGRPGIRSFLPNGNGSESF